MKRTLVCMICFFTLAVTSTAQTSETFDIATFKAPAGWQKQSKDGVLILSTSNTQKSSYAMVAIYRSGDSSGNANTDFAADWQEFIAGQLGVTDKPQVEPAKDAAGWKIVTGGSTFKNENGTSAVILNTYSSSGKKFSFAAIFNSQDYVPTIEAFMSSLTLSKQQMSSQAAPASNPDSSSTILGTWGMATSATQRSDDYKNPYSANNVGYSKAQYTFNGDGTYSFFSKTFKMTFDKILLVRETGSYQINGNSITITPSKSSIEAWSKRNGTDKFGALLTRQNRPLEKVNYQFTKHYFSGIQLWNLVLQAEKPTERDGPFSGNTTFPNAWYYAPISSNNTVIELP